MFNFYVILAGNDKFSDTSRATTCTLEFEALSLQTKSTKTDRPFENMSFSKKPLEDFNKKNNIILVLTKKPRGTHCP